jgi:hypothetical protein
MSIKNLAVAVGIAASMIVAIDHFRQTVEECKELNENKFGGGMFGGKSAGLARGAALAAKRHSVTDSRP